MAPTARLTTFLENFNYPHSHVILELAVVLKSDKAFEEFTQALMAFLYNAQMVDPKFVINLLNPNSKERNIASKGKISSNLTKLGAHVKISGNGNVLTSRRCGTGRNLTISLHARPTKKRSSGTRRYTLQ